MPNKWQAEQNNQPILRLDRQVPCYGQYRTYINCTNKHPTDVYRSAEHYSTDVQCTPR